MCIHVYTHRHTREHTATRAHTHTRAREHAHTQTRAHAYEHTRAHTNTHARTRTHTRTHNVRNNISLISEKTVSLQNIQINVNLRFSFLLTRYFLSFSRCVSLCACAFSSWLRYVTISGCSAPFSTKCCHLQPFCRC